MSITNTLKLINDFGRVSGSMLNLKKSYIIEICESNEQYTIEGLTVLKNTYEKKLVKGQLKTVFTGDFIKVLGIYFCASVKHYVNKNWFETFIKSGKVINMWNSQNLSLRYNPIHGIYCKSYS